jgi:hypothetical protein
MTSNNIFKSDLYKIHNIVQSSAALYPKELIIATLRNYFADDTYYGFRKDKFGFPETPDLTNTPQNAGNAVNDSSTTRLFIGESYRFDVIYYPAITVRHGGSTYAPISFNREATSIQWDFLTFVDGYGNVKKFRTPNSFIFAGAWEGSINIDIKARDLRSRDDLVDLVMMLFTDVAFEDMRKAGVIVKGTSLGAPNQEQDRSDWLFTQSITLQIRSEWRRKIPVSNIVDIINTSIQFARTDPTPGPVAANLTINTSQNLSDILKNL